MTEVYPEYYESFRCIADRCEDTCCAGWEIDIDDASYDAYMRVGGDLGARLRACIKTYDADPDSEENDEYEEVYEQHGFVLTKDMRCPFLDEHNLCDLYKELGEDSLCEVCTNTPRNFLEYKAFSDTDGEDANADKARMLREISVSASCPEAARLIYGSPEKMRFVEKEISEDDPISEHGGKYGPSESLEEVDEDEPILGRFLKNVRADAIDILQNRDNDINSRIRIFLQHAEGVQEAINVWEAGDKRLPERVPVPDMCGGPSDEKEGYVGSEDKSGDVPGKDYAYRHFLIRMGSYSGLASIGFAWQEKMEELYDGFVGDEEDETVNDAKNGEFSKIYKETSDNLIKYLIEEDRLYEYEHLLVYYAFLLLNRSIDDYDYLGKAKLVVLSYLMNKDMDAAVFLKKGILSKEDREKNARIYAREVEHAEENLADLFEEILFERAYDSEGLCAGL